MIGFVYILKNTEGKFYVGSTNNIGRRLKQHTKGHTQTTKNMKFLTLAFHQQYDSLKQARKIEQKIKKLKRKDYIEKIIKDGYVKMT